MDVMLFADDGVAAASIPVDTRSAVDLECASASSSIVLESNLDGERHVAGINSSSFERDRALLEGFALRFRIEMPLM